MSDDITGRFRIEATIDLSICATSEEAAYALAERACNDIENSSENDDVKIEVGGFTNVWMEGNPEWKGKLSA